MKTTFTNIEDFYNDNPARRPSRECDYGLWTDPARHRDSFRISYVQATGEVYAARLAQPDHGPIQLLGLVLPDPSPHPLRSNFHITLDRILDGWTNASVRHQGPQWVKDRLAAAGRTVY